MIGIAKAWKERGLPTPDGGSPRVAERDYAWDKPHGVNGYKKRAQVTMANRSVYFTRRTVLIAASFMVLACQRKPSSAVSPGASMSTGDADSTEYTDPTENQVLKWRAGVSRVRLVRYGTAAERPAGGALLAIPRSELNGPLPPEPDATIGQVLLRLWFGDTGLRSQGPGDLPAHQISIALIASYRSAEESKAERDEIIQRNVKGDDWQAPKYVEGAAIIRYQRDDGYAWLQLYDPADTDPDGSTPLLEIVGNWCTSNTWLSAALSYTYQFDVSQVAQWPVIHRAMRDHIRSLVVEEATWNAASGAGAPLSNKATRR